MSITPLPAQVLGKRMGVAASREEWAQASLPGLFCEEAGVPAGFMLGDAAGWSFALMQRVCEHKGIRLSETSAFFTRKSALASCGDVVILKVRKEMDEPSKIAAVAHELGHVALGHTATCCAAMWDARIGQGQVEETLQLRSRERVLAGVVPADGETARIAGAQTSPRDDADAQEQRRAAQEREASIWAAHLLVRGEIFNAFLNDLRAEGIDAEPASQVAAVRTGKRLNIPQEVVECWVYNYEWQFLEPPLRWFERSGR